MRWLGSFAVLVGLALLSTSAANAQVFKPKSSKSATEKKAKPAAKKKAASSKKSSKKKKSAVAERSRPDDLTPEVASNDESEDSDYVKITDDDEIE